MKPTVTTGNLVPEPEGDLEFDTHEDAYFYYKEYAKSVGFGTAKLSSRRSRATKEFIDAKFSCIRYGNKQQSDDAVNPRPSPKIGCKASMHVKRKQNGKWYVSSFVKDHNHELLPEQAHFFRSHRSVETPKDDMRMRKRKVLAAGSKQLCAYENVELLEGYIRNQHDKGRFLYLENDDSKVLLDFCMHMQDEDPKFYYAVDLNEEHKLRNVFWVSSKGVDDYQYFSDVVSVDTTYIMGRANYKIPLVIFVGVNNHLQPILLGCGLIADGTFYTFLWLMQTWLLPMGGRAPRVILTEQNGALKNAVAAVLPDTRHCLSLWNILERIPMKLDYASPWQDNFVTKFHKCIYRSWTEEQFERRWSKFIDRFNLNEDEWVKSLYDDRKQWVPIFMRDVSLAGLSAASRSNSLNAWFDKYIDELSSVKEFIERYNLIMEDLCVEEARVNFDAWHETPELKTPSPFEKQMLFVYTHEMFKKFQAEVLGAAACHLNKENEFGTLVTYSVKDCEDNQVYMVSWDQSKQDVGCSCRSYEYKGYVCRHAIVVLQMSGVFKIPSKYILQRWTNVALSRHTMSDRLDEVQSKVRRFNDLCRRAIILGEEGSLSEESYKVALIAIEETLKQLKNTNNVGCDPGHFSGLNQDICDTVIDSEGNSIAAITRKPGATCTIKSQALTYSTCSVSNLSPKAQHDMIPGQSQSLPTDVHSTMPAQYHGSVPDYFQDKHIRD